MNYELLELSSYITTQVDKNSRVKTNLLRTSTVTTVGQYASYIADDTLFVDVEKDAFIFKILVSSTYSFTLPLQSNGVYAFRVDWGDGSTSEITSYSDAEKTHLYTSAGEKTIKCYGHFEGIDFYNTGSTNRNMVTDISQWGDCVFIDGTSFRLCSNLDVSATDAPDLSKFTNAYNLFSLTGLTTPDFSKWDVSNVTFFNNTFSSCNDFVSGNLSNWDVSAGTNFYFMFRYSTKFNEDLSNWDVSSAVYLYSMFEGCYVFNSDISSWNITSAEHIGPMLNACYSFDHSIGDWDISNLPTGMNYFMSGVTLSTANYDDTLVKWAAKPHTNNVTISFGNSKYSSAAIAAREQLIADGWTITDGGLDYSESDVFKMEIFGLSSFSFTLPLQSTGEYAFQVDWGDSSDVEFITSYSDSDKSHWYSGGGYTIRLIGTIKGLDVRNTSSIRNYVTYIHQWGTLELINNSNFYGCQYLIVDATDSPTISATDLSGLFEGCYVDTPDLSGWDMSNVTTIDSMFYDTSFNGDVTSWDVSNVVSAANTFAQSSFDQDLSNWDISSLEDASDILDSSSLSTSNYDALLIGWAANTHQNNVTLGVGTTKYTSAAQSARDQLVADGWTITDGGSTSSTSTFPATFPMGLS